MELLTPSGTLVRLPYSEVKAVCFVRDFEGGETWREHRAFAARPKTPGLWIKLVFRDQDSTEGLLANNLMLVEEAGFHIIPPDPTFQTQRIFVPRLALREEFGGVPVELPLLDQEAVKIAQRGDVAGDGPGGQACTI